MMQSAGAIRVTVVSGALIVSLSAAHAADTVVNLAGFWAATADLAVAVLGAVLAFVAHRAADFLGVARDSRLREAILAAIPRQLALARRELGVAIDAVPDEADVRSALVAAAARGILGAYPEAVKKLRAKPKAVERLVDAVLERDLSIIGWLSEELAAGEDLPQPARRPALARRAAGGEVG